MLRSRQLFIHLTVELNRLRAAALLQEQLEKLGLNERQVKAIDFLKTNTSITNKEYQSLFDVTDRTALRDLDDMVSKGLITKIGEKKGTRYSLYHVGYVG